MQYQTKTMKKERKNLDFFQSTILKRISIKTKLTTNITRFFLAFDFDGLLVFNSEKRLSRSDPFFLVTTHLILGNVYGWLKI